MTFHKNLRKANLIALSLFLVATCTQSQQGPGSSASPHINQPIQITETSSDANAQHNREARLRQEEKLAADMDRLVLIANQLREEVSKRQPQTLSTRQIEETQEIEKLSKSIRKALKN